MSKRASKHIQWSNWAPAYLGKYKTKIVLYSVLRALPLSLRMYVSIEIDIESQGKENQGQPSVRCAHLIFIVVACIMCSVMCV